MPIPHAIRSVVVARMRFLQRSERGVIMRAAAIGQRFDLQLLAATTRLEEMSVRTALERACELQLIVVEDLATGRYRFRHALTREIVYTELERASTGPFHRRIAQALERRGASEAEALADLAYQFWAAGDARRARLYNERAGDQAAAVHAHEDALRFYERARSLISDRTPQYARLADKIRQLSDARRDQSD